MSRPSNRTLIVALLASLSAAANAEDRSGGTIPGNRGELVKPIVPGPPQYTQPQTPNAEKRDKHMEAEDICTLTDSYLDPAVASRAPPLEPADLYSGWLGSRLIGEDVYGRDGGKLGEVQDVLVGGDARITAITVEGGGFLGIADGAFRAPWSMVDRTTSRDGIKIELTENEAQRRGLFEGPEKARTAPGEFRLTEIRGDWTRIGNVTTPCYVKRGYVRDVVFSQAGRILSVLETRSSRLGGGTHAYPFYGYQEGWHPFYGYYDLPLESMSRPAPNVELKRFHPAS
jgi:hypothetical protein